MKYAHKIQCFWNPGMDGYSGWSLGSGGGTVEDQSTKDVETSRKDSSMSNIQEPICEGYTKTKKSNQDKYTGWYFVKTY